MLKDISKNIIFLHGLSGSGKGEIQRQLTSRFETQGYKTIYGSSGELLRAGFANPFIRERLLKGYYFDTLEPIVPGLENIFMDFLSNWNSSKGKTVLILDGVIRRTDFVNGEGAQIPSQVKQLAVILDRVAQGLVDNYPELLEKLPEYKAGLNDEERVNMVQDVLKGANHIVTDLRPEDAERQMKSRALKEVRNIIATDGQQNVLPPAAKEDTELLLRLIETGQTSEGEGTVMTSDTPFEVAQPSPEDELKRIKSNLAEAGSIEGETVTLADVYKHFGIDTAIREDDITINGRRNRVKNFVLEKEEGGTIVYESGFASQALAKDLGFKLSPEVSFESTSPNCFVIQNGESQGVSLETFRNRAGSVADSIYSALEGGATPIEGHEGMFQGKER